MFGDAAASAAPAGYQSTLSPDCWNRPGFAACMNPQYTIASAYCEKLGTLTADCVGKYTDELGRTACNCGATPTAVQNLTGGKTLTQIMPAWAWVLVGGAGLLWLLGKGKK